MTGAADGYLREVFRSIQGEGPYVGVLQVFVRLAGCAARCRYCDAAEARVRAPRFSARLAGRAIERDNPVSPDELLDLVRPLAETAGFHSMSVTGGEPLEQPAFLAPFLDGARGAGIPVYLETNGLPFEGARAVRGLVDYVSLDIKLPSLCPGVSLDAYRRVLPLFDGAELFCKAVVAEEVTAREIEDAARVVAEHDPETTFVIQPATLVAGCRPPGPAALLELHEAASRLLRDVRVIPQCHRLMGVE